MVRRHEPASRAGARPTSADRKSDDARRDRAGRDEPAPGVAFTQDGYPQERSQDHRGLPRGAT